MKNNQQSFSLSPDYRCRCWEGLCIVYYIPTGETHLLEAMSAVIVEQLQITTIATLSELHQNIIQLSIAEYSRGLLDTYLRQLSLLGILTIEKSSDCI